MAENTLLTIDMITRELMFQLENSLTFAKHVNRNYDDKFAQTGAKIGDTLTIRLPPLFKGRDGRVVNIEGLKEQSVAVSLKQFGVDLDFTSKDLTLSLDDFSERFLRSAAARIANKVDQDGMAEYWNVYNTVGTPGTIPNDLDVYNDAAAWLDDEAVPRDGMRHNCIGPWMQSRIVTALKGLFHDSTEISRQYKEGTMGLAAGFKWSMDQNAAVHTVGALGGTPVVAGANQTGATLATSGWPNSTQVLNRGDTFTVGTDVYGINPRSYNNHVNLRRFVATADVTSDGSGNASIPISPSIIIDGAYQTVSKSPDNGAAITPLGAAGTQSVQGIAHHRDAFVLATCDLEKPNGVHECTIISDEQLGISIRMIWAYDAVNDQFICRTDILYGWVTARPQLAVRIAS